MPAARGCVLAFDYGEKHIGVATGQTVTRTATPLTTLRARNGKPDWRAVDALVGEWAPVRLLVGLPLNMDDTESPMCARARRFADTLGRRSGIRVEMVDERLTSFASRGTSARGSAEPNQSHALAAALIAETWLGGEDSEPVPA